MRHRLMILFWRHGRRRLLARSQIGRRQGLETHGAGVKNLVVKNVKVNGAEYVPRIAPAPTTQGS
jgi:hypothetical protein